MLKKILLGLQEFIKMAAIAVVIIVAVRYFLIQPFYVKGASMEPTFSNYEYLIIDELSYRFKDPQRGQVVVFRYPRDPQEHFIKRVIGLPGETVQIKDNHVYIYNEEHPHGYILKEDYLADDEITIANSENLVKLGADEYYVLGDNRDASQDSRFFGPVKRSFITGKVWIRGFPINRWNIFTAKDLPQY
ncbi:MAG: signal peptidase I [Patescibacteria group bacterium]|jgi:signal peptidase I